MKNTKKNLVTVNDIALDLGPVLRDYTKASPRSQVSNVVRKIGAHPVGFAVAKSSISRLLVEPTVSFGSLLSPVALELDLEHRSWEIQDSKLYSHFKRVPGEPVFATIDRLKLWTKGLSRDELLGVAMVLCEIFLRRYTGVLLFTEYEWTGVKKRRLIGLYPELRRKLATEDPMVVPLELRDSPGAPVAMPGKFGATPVEGHKGYPLGWNQYTVGPDLKADLLALTRGEPTRLYPDVQTVSIPSDASAQLRAYYHRLEAMRLSGEIQAKLGARQLVRYQGETFSYPLAEDFRGRIYMLTHASPQTCKPLRQYLRSPSGEGFEFLDMKQSCVTLLSLLLTNEVPTGDVYLETAQALAGEWSGVLEDALGPPTRDLMKTWYKALWFGQGMISGYNQAMRHAVISSEEYRDPVRGEVLRVYTQGWKLIDSRYRLEIMPQDKPRVRTPDGSWVSLWYKQQVAKKRISRFYGRYARDHKDFVYLTTLEDGPKVDTRRTSRAITANLIHTLDAYILREQLRALSGLSLIPIHDCLGYLPSDRARVHDALPRVVAQCIRDFRPCLRKLVSNLPDNPGYPKVQLEDIYELES